MRIGIRLAWPVVASAMHLIRPVKFNMRLEAKLNFRKEAVVIFYCLVKGDRTTSTYVVNEP